MINVFAGFQSPALTEAAELRVLHMAQHGKVDELAVSLFDAAGLSFVLPGKQGASPKGALAAFTVLASGPKPVFDKDTREALAGLVKGWPAVCQGLHALCTMLHSAGACAAPMALPAWADPAVLDAAKAAAKSKREAAKAVAKATTTSDAGDSEGSSEASANVGTIAAPSAPSANLIAAAIKAQAYSASELAIIVEALHAANVLARETEEA